MEQDPRPAGTDRPGTVPQPSPARRILGKLISFVVGLALVAAIFFVLALFIVPGTPETEHSPVSRRATRPVTAEDYTAVEICSGCHWTIFTQWSGSMHSLANSDSFYAAMYDWADKDTNGKAEEFCGASMCHAPVGFLAGEDPFPHDELSPIAQQGVFCDFCHTIAMNRGVGDASYVASPGPVKRGPYRNAYSPAHQTAYSPLHTRSEFCGMCHNVSHPINGLKLETTYDEWARSKYNSRDPARRVRCQDCHMKPFRGRAASIGPRRAKVSSHYFIGGTSFISTALGHKRREPLVSARLKSAARVSFASSRRAGNTIQLAVRVTNVGAGHSIPTGVTEVRQVWLQVKGVADDGEEVFTSGAIDERGALDPKAHLFHTVLADGTGRPATKIWRAEKVLSDHRIPAGKSVIERYRFSVPPGTGRVTVTVTLMYRSAPQELVDQLTGKGKFKITPVEMARARTAT